MKSLLQWVAFQVSDLPEWTRLPLRPFVGHPERIALVAVVFVAGYVALRMRRPGVVRWPMILAAVTWAGFAVWEWECFREQGDIRIDLFLIYPFLVLLTLAGLVPSVICLAQGGHRA